MMDVHKIGKDGPTVVKATSLDHYINQPPTIIKGLTTSFSPEAFEAAYVSWMVKDNITLRQSVSKDLHKILLLLNPHVEPILWSSHNTSRSRIIEAYSYHKGTISEILAKAKSKISISFDGWMADTGGNFIGICFHFIDMDYKLQTTLCGMPRIKGEKSGRNQAAVILPVLLNFSLNTKNLGWFILDNATSNDTTLDELSATFSFRTEEKRVQETQMCWPQ